MGCYVMVGLASRRILLHPTTDHMVAQVFRLQQPHGGETSIRVRAWKCPLFFNKCKTLLLGLNWYSWWGFFFIHRPNKAVKIDSVLWLTLFFCFPFFFFFFMVRFLLASCRWCLMWCTPWLQTNGDTSVLTQPGGFRSQAWDWPTEPIRAIWSSAGQCK